MNLTKFIVLLLTLALAISGFYCSSTEEPTEEGSIPDKFVGTWQANNDLEETSIVYTSVANPALSIDVTALASVTATINKSGAYNLTFVDPISGTDTDQGTASIDETNGFITLNSSEAGAEDLIFAYDWDGDLLVLQTLTTFDFTGQGEEEAVVKLTLKKTP